MFFLESYKRATTILSPSEYSAIKITTAASAASAITQTSTSTTSSMLDWTCARGSNTTGLPMMDTFSGIGCFQVREREREKEQEINDKTTSHKEKRGTTYNINIDTEYLIFPDIYILFNIIISSFILYFFFSIIVVFNTPKETKC